FRILRVEALLRDRGVQATRSALLDAYDRQGDLLESMWAEHRELSPDEQVRAFMQFSGLDTKDRDLFTAVDEAIHGAIVSRPPATFPHIEDTLRSLSEQGLIIGLISNTGRTWGRSLTEVQTAAGNGQEGDGRGPSDSRADQVPRPRGPDPPPAVPRFDQRVHRAADNAHDDRVRRVPSRSRDDRWEGCDRAGHGKDPLRRRPDSREGVPPSAVPNGVRERLPVEHRSG